jgi:hypothetical protein
MHADPDPLFELWLAWLEEGRLEPELAALRQRDPAAFESRAAEVRGLLSGLAAARFEPLTASERAAALGLLAPAAPWRQLAGRLVELAQRVLSAADLAPALRGSLPSQHFQGLYRAGSWDIDLDLGEDGRLFGQVLRRDGGLPPAGARVELWLAGAPQSDAALDADGSFALRPPPGSAFELLFVLGEERLLVGGLPILA